MSWRDSSGSEIGESLRTIGVAALFLATLALAALETWIEYTAHRGPTDLAAGVEPVSPGLRPGAESGPTP